MNSHGFLSLGLHLLEAQTARLQTTQDSGSDITVSGIFRG